MTNTITYKQLAEALSGLGFQAHDDGAKTVYSKADHDAVIVVPYEGSGGFVLPQYVVAARETVIGKGIANKQEFDQLLGRLMTEKTIEEARFRMTAKAQSLTVEPKGRKKASKQRTRAQMSDHVLK